MEKREIKFRAWNKIDQAIVIWEDMLLAPNPTAWFTGHGNTIILMQYTGLKDCKGNDIYESDLVKIVSINEIREVIYHKCSFGVAIDEVIFAPVYWHGDVEVIGNIYEHPSLLTEIKR